MAVILYVGSTDTVLCYVMFAKTGMCVWGEARQILS